MLFLNCASGKPIKTAVLFVRNAGVNPVEYYTITLSDVLVSNVRTAGSDGRPPHESFSLSYGKIEFSYKLQKLDGSLGTPIKTGWDLVNNVALP